MKRITSLIALFLSFVITVLTMTGCNKPTTNENLTLEDIELSYRDYTDSRANGYNTELFYRNEHRINLGDPAVLYIETEDGGYYYATGTRSGKSFEMWRSRDLSNWEDLGTVYSPPADFFGQKDFWAPQLLFDPQADWQHYLGESAGEGTGLYLLFFSARGTDGSCQLAATFSKKIDGPYTHFAGTNANGDAISAANPLFEMKHLEGLGLYEDHPYGALYKEGRSFIDACPYIDPVSGEKYLYMVRSRRVDASNDVWGLKMKDWVSPDYPTTVPLSSYGYTTVEQKQNYRFTTRNKIDEGPFLYYKDCTDDGVENGKYYLTLSIGDTNDKLYPVCQAIGDTPLGPFTKIQPQKGGLLNTPEQKWDIHGSGHHAFFEVGDELYIAYHNYEILTPGTIGKRYLAYDKVEWTYNEDGQYIMHTNGPTKTPQPLPASSSGYRNLSPLATVTASSGDASLLNDRLIARSESDIVKEYSTTEDATVTLTFADYVTARAILIYNSYDIAKAFTKIERIEFSYRKTVDGKTYTGKAIINGLGFDVEANRIPTEYLVYQGEGAMDQLRACGAAIAEFDELEINKVTIHLKKAEGQEAVNLSEIMLLGK